MITTAFIKIWNETVGAVAWNLETGIASFEYDPKFITKNWDLSPLKMPLTGSSRRIFSFPELKDIKTFKGLPGLLADVLPDDVKVDINNLEIGDFVKVNNLNITGVEFLDVPTSIVVTVKATRGVEEAAEGEEKK